MAKRRVTVLSEAEKGLFEQQHRFFKFLKLLDQSVWTTSDSDIMAGFCSIFLLMQVCSRGLVEPIRETHI